MKLQKHRKENIGTTITVLILASGLSAFANTSDYSKIKIDDRLDSNLQETIIICQSPNENVVKNPITESNTRKPTITLSGEIGHADELKPIEPMLQAGSKFDNRILKVFKPQDYWYQIPNWLGGIWQRNEQNLLKQKSLTFTDKIKSSLYPPRLGKFKSQVKYRWGYQYDRVGSIWNYAKFPYIVKVDGANTYTIQVVREATPLSVSDKVVTLKFRSTSHKINARTNVIMFAEQAEAISMFAKYEPNTLYVRYSRKVFDSKGKPRSIQESDSFIPRVTKFFPLNNLKGKDLRASLRNYLAVHKPNLVPPVALPQNGMQAIRPFQPAQNYILVPSGQNPNYQNRLDNRMNPNINQAYPNMYGRPIQPGAVYPIQPIQQHPSLYRQGNNIIQNKTIPNSINQRNSRSGSYPSNSPWLPHQFRQQLWRTPIQLKLHQEQYRNQLKKQNNKIAPKEKEQSPVPHSHQPPEVKLEPSKSGQATESKDNANASSDKKDGTKHSKDEPQNNVTNSSEKDSPSKE